MPRTESVTTIAITPAAKKAAKQASSSSAPPLASLNNLTDDQIRLADLAADLLVSGGQPELFSRFLYVLTQHEFTKQNPARRMDPQELQKKMKEYANSDNPVNAALKARLMHLSAHSRERTDADPRTRHRGSQHTCAIAT